MQPVITAREVVAVEFKDGRRMFGIWSRMHRSLAVPLFHDLAEAQSVLVTGCSRMCDEENAKRTAEEVEVRLLGEGESGAVVLITLASWSEAHVTGPWAALDSIYMPVTDEMLAVAMAKAVETGLVAEHVDTETHLQLCTAMKACFVAALRVAAVRAKQE